MRLVSALLLVCLVSSASALRTVRSKWIQVTIGDKDCNVDDYGAKGDAKTDDTDAIRRALVDCGKDGGRVTIGSAGQKRSYRSKALTLQSNTELNIPESNVLLIDNDREKWPAGKAILNADKVTHVAVTGPGTLDGQGLVWWQHRNKDKYDKNRPKMIYFKGSQVLIHNVTFRDPPNHCMELYTDYTEVSHATVLAPASTAPEPSHNTDAVDIHGSPFLVHDCYFSTGDDNIAAHANDTIVEDCHFGTGHGASIGSLGEVYLRNITMRNIVFEGTDAGPKIKVHGDAKGGRLWDVTYENLKLHDVKDPISVTMDYHVQGNPKFTIENLMLRNISSSDSTYSGDLCRGAGSDSTCKNFTFSDVNLNSKTWTCQGKSSLLQGKPKEGCDCFTNVQGQAENTQPQISGCLKGAAAVLPFEDRK